MFNIMVGIVKSFKIKVDKNSYLLLEKEEDYLILKYLERIFFDLFRNISFTNDEHKKIRVFFRMALIENYLKNLNGIKLKSCYIKKCKNPFKIRFPNLSRIEHFVYSEENYKILEDLNVMHGLESSEDPEDPELQRSIKYQTVK